MSSTTWIGSLRVGFFTALSLGVTGAVIAQQSGGGAPQGSAGGLEEVVVTAEKRSTSVLETPISITAITGKDIEARGLADFTSLAQTVPGMSMKSSGPGETEFEMRGMTSSGGNSATVGFYLDDTPLSAPAAAQNGKVVIDPNLYDLNRVEVLRGPQGTLYGSGSMGGTVKIVTNQPNPDAFDVSGQVILSDTDGGGFNHGENAMVNIPFGGGIAALRIVGSFEHDSGWIDRIVIAPGEFPPETNFSPALGNFATRGNVAAAPVSQVFSNVNDEKLTGARISLLIRPTDRLSITPAFFYQEITQNGLSQIDSDPGTNTQYQPFDSPEPFVDRIDLASLNIQYHFDGADLTSQTSYWTRDQEIRQDGTEEIQWALSSPVSGLPAAGIGCPAPLPFLLSQPCGFGPTSPTPLENDKSWQTSQELRLASSGDGKFQWLLGYFYSDFESDWDLYVLQPGAATAPVPGTNIPIFGTGDAFTQVQPTKIVQNSFFGEASYRFTSQLTATVGLRRYSYNNDVNTAVSGFLSSTGSATTAYSESSERNQGLNPKFGMSWEPDKNLLTYISATKGFRPGGANQPVPTGSNSALGKACEADLQEIYSTTATVPSPATFGPDSVWSYELGEKWRTNDGRVSVNGAVYYSRWNDAQQFVPLSCGFNFSTNTGDAKIYGGELEVNAALTDDLLLSVNGGYTHAEFIASTVLPGVAATNGLGVQEIPDWTSNVSLTYRHPITDDIRLFGRIENTYVASRTEVTFALYTLPSYSLTNLRLGAEGNKWTATLFAKNLFNKVAYINNGYQINLNVPTYNRVTVAQPLTIGIDLTYHLGR